MRKYNLKLVGYDFWLTRTGHATEFPDGSYPEPFGALLAKSCKRYADYNLFVAEDLMLFDWPP